MVKTIKALTCTFLPEAGAPDTPLRVSIFHSRRVTIR